MIQVQAGVAVHLTRKRGEEVPPALLAIHEAGADAARELRATLGVLRSHDNDPGEDCDGSGLGQLDNMVARARSAGLPVTVTVTGTQRPLPPAVDQAAYRIVQEALTNVVRHAVPATAELTLRYRPCEVVIEVTDNGGTHQKTPSPARTGHGPGHGIAGMRERVAVYGGKLVAEPTGSGFHVLARIPTEEAAS